jgi:hypothetical protein
MTREYVHYNLTDEDKTRIVSLYKELNSAVKVSKIVGFKLDKIYDVLRDSKIERHVTSKGTSKNGVEVEQRIISLYENDSATTISKKTGVAVSSVIHVLSKHGVYQKVNKPMVFIRSASDKRKICFLYEDKGLTIREIAAEFNTSVEPIRKILLKNGIKLNPMAKGIQERISFKSKSGKEYTLKSWYEFNLAKTLDRLNFTWDYEPLILRLGRRRYYRPDFILYENNTISWVVETKGDINAARIQRVKKVQEAIKKYPNLKIVILFKQDLACLKDVLSPYAFTKFLEKGYGKTCHLRLPCIRGPARSNAGVQTG